MRNAYNHLNQDPNRQCHCVVALVGLLLFCCGTYAQQAATPEPLLTTVPATFRLIQQASTVDQWRAAEAATRPLYLPLLQAKRADESQQLATALQTALATHQELHPLRVCNGQAYYLALFVTDRTQFGREALPFVIDIAAYGTADAVCCACRLARLLYPELLVEAKLDEVHRLHALIQRICAQLGTGAPMAAADETAYRRAIHTTIGTQCGAPAMTPTIRMQLLTEAETYLMHTLQGATSRVDAIRSLPTAASLYSAYFRYVGYSEACALLRRLDRQIPPCLAGIALREPGYIQ